MTMRTKSEAIPTYVYEGNDIVISYYMCARDSALLKTVMERLICAMFYEKVLDYFEVHGVSKTWKKGRW